MQLYLDADGVLANFDKRAQEILGIHPREYEAAMGKSDFWDTIYSTDDFFFSLEPMPDAYDLVNAVKHLKPIILTGIPSKGDSSWAIPQKVRWRDTYFPDLPIYTCKSADKCMYCAPGDIIVDDWEEYRHKWIGVGGHWITHTSAENSINELMTMGVL